MSDIDRAIKIVQNLSVDERKIRYDAWRNQKYFQIEIIEGVEKMYPPSPMQPSKTAMELAYEKAKKDAMLKMANGIDPQYKRPCCGG